MHTSVSSKLCLSVRLIYVIYSSRQGHEYVRLYSLEDILSFSPCLPVSLTLCRKCPIKDTSATCQSTDCAREIRRWEGTADGTLA